MKRLLLACLLALLGSSAFAQDTEITKLLKAGYRIMLKPVDNTDAVVPIYTDFEVMSESNNSTYCKDKYGSAFIYIVGDNKTGKTHIDSKKDNAFKWAATFDATYEKLYVNGYSFYETPSRTYYCTELIGDKNNKSCYIILYEYLTSTNRHAMIFVLEMGHNAYYRDIIYNMLAYAILP